MSAILASLYFLAALLVLSWAANAVHRRAVGPDAPKWVRWLEEVRKCLANE